MALANLPTEILLNTFYHLPSFHDAFRLASTCHRFKQILLDYADPIYAHLAPLSTPCEHHARTFYATHSAIHRPFSIPDVLTIIRGSKVIRGSHQDRRERDSEQTRSSPLCELLLFQNAG